MCRLRRTFRTFEPEGTERVHGGLGNMIVPLVLSLSKHER